MEKQIEEMARDICECYNSDGTCYQDDMPCDLKCEHMTQAQFIYEKGYRKERQGECEYCKTGDEKCQTCTEFYKNTDDRCSGYDDGKCIVYKPVKYCFNCGAKMRGE